MSALLDVLLADQRRIERRQMTAAQIAYDNAAEPDDDDELLTEDQALTLAMEELQTTPAVVAEWLDDECGACRDSLLDGIFVLVRRANAYDRTMTPAELLAVLMGGHGDAPARALTMLRDAFERDNGAPARERATELLAEQALAIERALDESEAARAESAAYWRAMA